MCSSKSKQQQQHYPATPKVAHINDLPVLQPTSNHIPSNSVKKTASPKSPTSATNVITKSSLSPPISPKLKSPRLPVVKRGNVNPNKLNSSAEQIITSICTKKSGSSSVKKPKSISSCDGVAASYDSSSIVEAPGSIAAARREQVAIMQEQRKLRIVREHQISFEVHASGEGKIESHSRHTASAKMLTQRS